MTANLLPKYIPHSGPKGAKLLCVGNIPGETEYKEGIPFTGTSGVLLRTQLSNNGINPDSVRFANLCNYRPFDNKFEHVRGTRELTDGLGELGQYINNYKPNVIAALGSEALFYLTGKANEYTGIGLYRGSILRCLFDPNIKVIPTYHPAKVQQNPKNYPVFNIDIGRIVSDSKFPEFNYTPRNYYINPTDMELYEFKEKIKAKGLVSCDIENVKKTRDIICVGFGLDRHNAVVIPYDTLTRMNIVREIMEDDSIKKIFHYGTHDVEVFYLNGINVNGYLHDTMAIHSSLAPELSQSLAFIGSVFTREPYYKSEGRGDLPDDSKAWSSRTDRNTVYIYNGKDCCVTIEAFEEMMKEMSPAQLRTYAYMMRHVHLTRYISRQGMPVDVERRNKMLHAMQIKWYKLQLVYNSLCAKVVNVNSPPVVAKLLYDDLGLPVKRNKTGGRATGEDQIVELITYCKGEEEKVKLQKTKAPWQRAILILRLTLEIRGIRKLISQYFGSAISEDGRVRGTFGPYTETWRYQCSKYADDTGFNLQTIPRDSVNVPTAEDEILDLTWIKKELEMDKQKEEEEELEEVA